MLVRTEIEDYEFWQRTLLDDGDNRVIFRLFILSLPHFSTLFGSCPTLDRT
jgi:hypothetical protein